MPVKDMTDKDKWLLALIGSTPYIRGRTRLQKIWDSLITKYAELIYLKFLKFGFFFIFNPFIF